MTHRYIDSSVALHWIKVEKHYKQFVSNCVSKIKEKGYVLWRHVPTESHPADIASRCCDAMKLNIRWFNGPEWMTNTNEWPEDIVTVASADSESEAKLTKSILKVAVESKVELDMVLEKYQYRKSMRVVAWIKRFIQNCQAKKENRQTGQLAPKKVEDFWIKKEQSKVEGNEKFEEERQQLGLKKNEEGIYICHGRLEGEYPIYLPSDSLFSERLVAYAHHSTLCGGPSLTMAKVRQEFWIPRLRKLVNKVRKTAMPVEDFI